MRMKHFIHLIRPLRIVTRLNVIFKSAGPDDTSVSEEFYNHCHPFCRAVKARPGMLTKCARDDIDTMIVNAGRTGKPYIKTCHAGVCELVVPVFTTEFIGSLCIGPVRPRGKNAVYPYTRELFQKLTPLDTRFFAGTRTLLKILASYIADEEEAIALRERSSSVKNKKVAAALHYIGKKLPGAVSVSEAARIAGVSPSRFVHLFKEETGITFTDYVIRCRMERAKRLLARSTLPVTDIAFECGYANQSYFSSVFRRITGVSPKAYQRAHAKKQTP